MLPLSILAQGGLPNQPYIYVEGRAEVEKPADMVTLRFNAAAHNADQSKANQEVQSKASKILALLTEKKIGQADVIAENLTSEPILDDAEGSRGRGKIIGYSVIRPFEVKVRDVAIFPRLVDELIGIGGVQFATIDGGLAQKQELEQDVFQKALADAKSRAERTLALTGMKIDSVFAVSPVSFVEIQQNILGRQDAAGSAEIEGIVGDPLRYRLAPVTVSQTIHIIYLISPAK
jgi:uncharacterized protein YggE